MILNPSPSFSSLSYRQSCSPTSRPLPGDLRLQEVRHADSANSQNPSRS